eukprot:453237-Lingulodinium_polyedra.AAC.1
MDADLAPVEEGGASFSGARGRFSREAAGGAGVCERVCRSPGGVARAGGGGARVGPGGRGGGPAGFGVARAAESLRSGGLLARGPRPRAVQVLVPSVRGGKGRGITAPRPFRGFPRAGHTRHQNLNR